MSTIINEVGDGTRTDFTITFDYISQDHVKVTVAADTVTPSFLTPSTISISPAPAAGAAIRLWRETPTERLVDFTDGSILNASELDLAATQAAFVAEEARDLAASLSTDAATSAAQALASAQSAIEKAQEAVDAATAAGANASTASEALAAIEAYMANPAAFPSVALWDAWLAAVPAFGTLGDVVTVAGIPHVKTGGGWVADPNAKPDDITAAVGAAVASINTDLAGKLSAAAGAVGSANLASGAVVTAKLGDGAATNAKLANAPAQSLKGNSGTTSAAPADLTVAQVLALLGLTKLSGLTVVGGTGTSAAGAATTVTLPYTFTSAPFVVGTMKGGAHPANGSVRCSGHTTTAFDVNIYDAAGTRIAASFDYIAIGVTA